MEYSYSQPIRIADRGFDREEKSYYLDLEPIEIEFEPLRVIGATEESIDLEFNRSFPHTYNELAEFEERLIDLIFEQREQLFNLKIPRTKLEHLFENLLRSPRRFDSTPRLRLSVEVDQPERLIGQYLSGRFEISRLEFRPTRFFLHQQLIEMKISDSSAIDPESDETEELFDSE